MAWITDKQRTDGGTSYTVHWRTGGTRTGRQQAETFSAGTDAQNAAHAEGLLQMVTAAGQQWPAGWVKGRGFVHQPTVSPTQHSDARPFDEVGLEYVEQIVLLSPGQRKKVQVDDPGAGGCRGPRTRRVLPSFWRTDRRSGRG
jgi:hypothetical protein